MYIVDFIILDIIEEKYIDVNYSNNDTNNRYYYYDHYYYFLSLFLFLLL